MYCNRCRIEFDPWLDRWGHVHNSRCKSCREIQYQPGTKDAKGAMRYCIVCGVELPNPYFRYCSKHKPQAKVTTRRCIVCGVEIGRSVKFCPEHKPKPGKIYPVTNRRSSIAWQKSNPEKYKAQVLAQSHPYLLNILYECRCEAKKEKHHFDYSKPYDVLLLCSACHAAEHKRLRSLSNTPYTPDQFDRPRAVAEAASA